MKRKPKTPAFVMPLTTEEVQLLDYLRSVGITHVAAGAGDDDKGGLMERDGRIYLLYYRGGETRTQQHSLGKITWEKAKDLRNLVRKTFPCPKKNRVIDVARRIIEDPDYFHGLTIKVRVGGLYRGRTFTSQDSDKALKDALEWRRAKAHEIVENSNTGKTRRYFAKAE